MPFMAANKRLLSLITGLVGDFMTLTAIGTPPLNAGATTLTVAIPAAMGTPRRHRETLARGRVSPLALPPAAGRLTPPFVPEPSRNREGNARPNRRRHVQRYFTRLSQLFAQVVSQDLGVNPDRGVSRRADVLALPHAGKNSG